MLPIDLVFVRHGRSEGNEAKNASQKGNNSFFTPDFLERHSRSFRLTNKGIKQAKEAAKWLHKKFPSSFDAFYVSDYIRAKETAVFLNLARARWQVHVQLRERDKGLMDNLPESEKRRLFARELRQYETEPFFAYPAGGGESVAGFCQRLNTSFVEPIIKRCSLERLIVVSHGHVMRGMEFILEDLSHDEFLRIDRSEKPKDKIRNGQIVWYTRRDPKTGKLKPSFVAVRTVCPWDPKGDYGWRGIEHHHYTNKELMQEVKKQKRQIE